MTSKHSSELLPGAGVIAGLAWFVTVGAGDLWLRPPDSTGDPAVIEQVLLGREPAAWTSILASVYVAVAIVLFAAGAQRRLDRTAYGMAGLGGGVLLAVAMLLMQGLGKFALLSAAHHHDLVSIRTLGYVDAVTWPFLSAGSGLFLLAIGFGSLRTQAMPRWLSIVSVVLGALALLGPGVLAFYFVAPVWFLAAGIALRRPRNVTQHDSATTHPVGLAAPGQ